MQYEEFDNKVRDAADHHHPAYDEKAWGKMEKMLDKHLPQENDNRKRFIFFLFLFLLLGGGAWTLINKPWEKDKQVVQVQQTTPEKNQNISRPINTSNKKETTKEKNNEFNNTGITGKNNTLPVVPLFGQQAYGNKNIFNSQEKKTNTKTKSSLTDLAITADSKIQQDYTMLKADGQNKISVDQRPTTITKPVTDAGTDMKVQEPVTGDSKSKSGESLNIEIRIKEIPKTDKIKNRGKKENSFFFTLSAGPDVSSAGSDKTGRAKLLAGAGFGYTFNNRFTIRTGFYSGRKIYSASPGEYHLPANSWNYYPNLEKVDADCEVYEIPLSVSYNFGNLSKQNWFASAGISSYLMKKETYNYFYKYTPTSPTINTKQTITDENNHLFSVLTLSGGYQRNIGKSVSLMVEPYLKLPLTGVGYGKVKLNSGGVLFSVGIKPFNNTGKKNKPAP